MIVIKNAGARRLLGVLLPIVAIPLVVLSGAVLPGGKSYLLISFGVAILALLLFITGFDRKKTGSRRLVLAAVMTALCVTGRFVPFFKPITAITVITAIYFGGESGFLVGAMSALLSNFYFGQGPWTPFQMVAWGMIGLLAGLLSKPLKRNRVLLCLFGVAAGVVYSLVMDVWTVLWYSDGFDLTLYLSAIVTAIPHTLLYSLSNFIFLFYTAVPFGQKLERVKLKYGV